MTELVPLDAFSDTFGTAIELSSVALGGRVVDVSDDFFAEAYQLLIVEPAPSLKGLFGPKGALYSGWESRRHNPAYDWCIIKLGTTGTVFGFDVDTTHFNGNEAPEVSIDALHIPEGGADPRADDPRWTELLPKVPLGPSSRHLFKIPTSSPVNYVKLNMYPDGGIARFRVYGAVSPVFPSDPTASFDVAHVFAGGRVVFTSDQHFGVGANLIIPGRGKDMGDGWETKRSRQKGHKDWAIIQLGSPAHLTHVLLDTAHFKGNFPESAELHACASPDALPALDYAAPEWIPVLPRTQLGPHREHHLQLANVAGRAYTHVRLTIHPDGGVKRVRVFGTRADPATKETQPQPSALSATEVAAPAATTSEVPAYKCGPTIPALPLTAEAFAPFGHVVQAYADPHGAPRGTRVTGANQGSARKFHKLAPLVQSYPSDAGAQPGISVYRCGPIALPPDGLWPVKLLERHPYTNQAFVPMGRGENEDALPISATGAHRYLVVVALGGDAPNLASMRAFVASAAQGVVYATGVWHHPMAVLDGDMDFACVETQIGAAGDTRDCEIVELEGAPEGFHAVVVPPR